MTTAPTPPHNPWARAMQEAAAAATAWEQAAAGWSADREHQAAAALAKAVRALADTEPPSLSPQTAEHLRALIAYNWDDELDDARENGAEAHIFASLVALDNLVNGTSHTVEHYLQSAGG